MTSGKIRFNDQIDFEKKGRVFFQREFGSVGKHTSVSVWTNVNSSEHVLDGEISERPSLTFISVGSQCF